MRTSEARSNALAALVVIAALAACSAEKPSERATTGTTPEKLTALVPSQPSPMSPSETRIGEPAGATIDANALADVDACDGCHADAVAQWKTSAHAFASFNNPVYRVSVERFRKEVGNDKSKHCGGCHDPALLVAGVMEDPIDPGDLRAHGGVTCRTCHGIESARVDGNGSYTLASMPIPLPKPGDADSVRVHKERAALKPLRSGVELCASCHRAFLSEANGNAKFFAGTDEPLAWQRSAYAGSHLARVDAPLEEKDCKGCHMPREASHLADVSAKQGPIGTGSASGPSISSHRFMGGHTWLASMRGDTEQLARAQAKLVGVARIDVTAARDDRGHRFLPAEAAPIEPGSRVTLDVVVKNLSVGHRFPGGTLDAQDTWIEVTVDDAKGRRLAEHGTGEDPNAHRLRALAADEKGQGHFERDVSHFRAVVTNHTLAPRDSEVIEYAFDLPASAELPLRVTAELRHRSRNLDLQRVACDESKSERGRSFKTKTPIDACAPQPITSISRAELWMGKGGEGHARSEVPLVERLLDHAFGRMHAVQEQIDTARPSLERALAELGESGNPDDRARVWAALGMLEGHEGRTAEALADFDRAEKLATPALHLEALDEQRGIALSEVWRWREAVEPLERAARRAPRDDLGWARLAVAKSSLGDDRGALDAARAGLGLVPRDADCLRIQSIALATLGADEAERARAAAAYEAFRVPDDVPKIKNACSKTNPLCALERIPLHEHAMRTSARAR